MACPLRAFFRTCAVQHPRANALSSLARGLCSSAENTVVPSDDVTMMSGVDRGSLATTPVEPAGVPESDSYSAKLSAAIAQLGLPQGQTELARRAMTDRSYSETIFHARRQSGNCVEILEADLHNERLAVLGNRLIVFVLTAKLLSNPQLRLSRHGVQELCYILTNNERLHTLLPSLKIDALVRSQAASLSNEAKSTAVAAIVGSICESQGVKGCREYVDGALTELNVEECHRVLTVNHPKLSLLRVLHQNGLAPPVVRITESESGEFTKSIVSGDRVLADVIISQPVSDEQQMHLACQRALVDNFANDLAHIAPPHSVAHPDEPIHFQEEAQVEFAVKDVPYADQHP